MSHTRIIETFIAIHGITPRRVHYLQQSFDSMGGSPKYGGGNIWINPKGYPLKQSHLWMILPSRWEGVNRTIHWMTLTVCICLKISLLGNWLIFTVKQTFKTRYHTKRSGRISTTISTFLLDFLGKVPAAHVIHSNHKMLLPLLHLCAMQQPMN